MKPIRTSLATALLVISCSLTIRAQNLFVDLGEVAGASPGTTNIDSPLGAGSGSYQYSAAAPVAGTTWNILPRVAAATLTAGQAGNPNISSAPGDYNLYSSPISLVDSLGASTAVSVNMISHYAGTSLAGSTRESIQFNNNTGAIPETLMGNNWRDQNNSATGPNTTWEFVFTGLTPNLSYDLYFYGSGNTAVQGITGTLGAANGGATASTTGIAAPTSIFDGTQSALVAQGSGWNVLNGNADGSGNLSFIASRGPNGQFFLNGMQLVALVPEPATAALFGLGMLLAIGRYRRQR
jgi:hypothetical protein